MKKTILLSLAITFAFSMNAQQSTTGKFRPANVSKGSTISTKTQVLISGVPSYIWTHGCGPTALGMVVGYYDGIGYPNLIDGDASTQGTNTNNAMANSEHYDDYSLPIDNYPDLFQDKSELGGAHTSNCIGDFMETSWSSENNRYGWSWSNMISVAFEEYLEMQSSTYSINTSYDYFSSFSWVAYKAEINNNRPVVILVDTDGDGSTDHFVTGIGYDESNSTYGIYDTWDNSIHWYAWRGLASGDDWGIFGFNIFELSNPTAIEGLNNNLAVNIYPNPASEIINIEIENSNNYNKIDIVLYDVVGKIIYETNASINQNIVTIDIPDNISGVFYLNIILDDKEISTKKLIIE